MRLLKGVIITSVIIGILLGFSLESSAVPNLQIYIPGATYEDETWVIESYDFELWVIGANYTLEDVKFAAAVPTNQDGSIEVTWLDNGSGESYPDYGSGSYGNDFSLTLSELTSNNYSNYLSTISSSSVEPDDYGFGLIYDDYPLYAEGDTTHIPGGGIFPTDFYEYYIGGFVPSDFDEVSNPVYDYNANDGYLYDPDAMILKDDGTLEEIGTATKATSKNFI